MEIGFVQYPRVESVIPLACISSGVKHRLVNGWYLPTLCSSNMNVEVKTSPHAPHVDIAMIVFLLSRPGTDFSVLSRTSTVQSVPPIKVQIVRYFSRLCLYFPVLVQKSTYWYVPTAKVQICAEKVQICTDFSVPVRTHHFPCKGDVNFTVLPCIKCNNMKDVQCPSHLSTPQQGRCEALIESTCQADDNDVNLSESLKKWPCQGALLQSLIE